MKPGVCKSLKIRATVDEKSGFPIFKYGVILTMIGHQGFSPGIGSRVDKPYCKLKRQRFTRLPFRWFAARQIFLKCFGCDPDDCDFVY